MADKTAALNLVSGKFGKALDGKSGGLEIPWDLAYTAYSKTPMTVECWAKPVMQDIVAICGQILTTDSWMMEINNKSEFGVYISRSSVWCSDSVVDGQWHYLAFTFDGNTLRIYVDGKEKGSTKVELPAQVKLKPGPVAMGTAMDPQVFRGCNGLVEELRISNIVRDVSAVPTAPMQADADTVGLWRMSDADAQGNVPDQSSKRNNGVLRPMPLMSIDEADRISFNAGPAPFDSPAEKIILSPGKTDQPTGAEVLVLDGTWKMAEDGNLVERLAGCWPDAIDAQVPGSVHTALQKAGKIPDPKFAKYDAMAREKSYHTWWFKKEFARPQNAADAELVFDGVAIRCTAWLNGTLLGNHEGMFGGPRFNIADKLQDNNVLIVRIDPAPLSNPDIHNRDNPAWQSTVVFNNVYGWHYSNIPSLGIWRSVRVEGAPAVKMADPFIAARDAKAGLVDLRVDLKGPQYKWSGKLLGVVEPENFTGKPFHFVKTVGQSIGESSLHLQFNIPDPQCWWPNDLGEPNLYRLKLAFVPDDGGTPDTFQTTFGLRTIEMAPLPGGSNIKLYDWTFVINGEKHFVKGNGWCTMDASMDFSRERTERFLKLGDLQHCQMMRAWGSGMPETDDFFDLCDRMGIMIIQEWPTAWNSHNTQPYDMMEETIRLNTIRLRNRASLVMWGGGNESMTPFGKAIDMMGRHSIELDGTRPFHRGEPWGGSDHNYGCWWGKAHLDHNMTMISPFWGEFGIATSPVYESVQRYLPDDEKNAWPAPANGSFVYHTPIFNRVEDMARLSQYSGYVSAGATMQRFIMGSQVAQAIALRHPLERARTRWPHCTGALYYKMNDNYPAASWSTADWYGAIKIAHYFCQDAFAPLHACVVLDSINNNGKALALPVFLMDDANALKDANWQVTVRAFDGKLQQIKAQTFDGSGQIDRVKELGKFELTAAQTDTTPLLLVVEVAKNGKPVDRTFYFVNFEAVKDSLFEMPTTTLSLKVDGTTATITNTGKLPAVGASVQRVGHLDTFTADENYIWLDAGESKTINVSDTQGLTVDAWNLQNKNW